MFRFWQNNNSGELSSPLLLYMVPLRSGIPCLVAHLAEELDTHKADLLLGVLVAKLLDSLVE